VNVGAPEPQKIPKFAVDDTLIPEVVAPAAGGAVEVWRLNWPVVDTVEPAVIAPDSVEAPVTDSVLVRDSALLIAPVVTEIPYIVPVFEVVKPTIASAEIVAFVIVGALIVGLVSVLLVSVCEAVRVTTVSDTLGSVYILVVPAVIPESWNWAFFVVSPSSTKVKSVSLIENVLVLSIVLFWRVWIVVVSTGCPVTPSRVERLIRCVAKAELV
jgi:hypothetical protein